ncbi:uncharacterized protein LOC126620830 isoform X1 [Malus sylvestris]|uniref:uncharacterized protein LOC126620830 isoform X1 n=1 Tax=Malus sylvestris TaxID=3752 RepID=UPI0021AC8A7B|nr:uncharacterized protein LOC126620830 isoform X1 [Malus sylvestris]
MSLLVPISRTPSRNASPNSLASSPARDWVFRVCDFSLKPAKTCVFKEIRFFGFLTFLCSLRRPLYLRKSPILQKLWVSWRVLRLICFGFLTRDLRHHCYTKLADGVPLSQTRSLRGHTSFSRLHRIATSEHCTGGAAFGIFGLFCLLL